MSNDKIKVDGCTRVIISDDGEAVPPSRAKEMGFEPDIIFKRKDGWTLGSPADFENVAFDLWRGEWTHFAEAGDEFYTPISEYP